MRVYEADGDAPVLIFAPGAGAGEDHPWMRRVGSGLARRGVTVVTFDFPYRQAGRRLPDRAPVLEAAYRDVWREVSAARTGAALSLGGKSMGGRIATQVAATLEPAPIALVCIGYPLHPPGRPAQRRDRHLPSIAVPLLFVQGSRDPFGSSDEMRELVGWLPNATLTIVDHGDHSLAVPAKMDPGGTAFDRALDAAATWLRGGKAILGSGVLGF